MSETTPIPPTNAAFTAPNGPLIATGDLQIRAGAEIRSQPRASLCRCGASANKPFCDGSHRTSGFLDPGEAVPADPIGELTETDTVIFTPFADGPLHAKGPITLQNAAKVTISNTSEVYLCRCGSSANKPYCDGSHAAIGFKG